jgi:hypothetical protein
VDVGVYFIKAGIRALLIVWLTSRGACCQGASGRGPAFEGSIVGWRVSLAIKSTIRSIKIISMLWYFWSLGARATLSIWAPRKSQELSIRAHLAFDAKSSPTMRERRAYGVISLSGVGLLRGPRRYVSLERSSQTAQ